MLGREEYRQKRKSFGDAFLSRFLPTLQAFSEKPFGCPSATGENEVRIRRRYRHNAQFVPDISKHCIRRDMDARVQIMRNAEELERTTRPKGRRNGVVSQIGLRVLRVLLFRFHRATDGMCCPSYENIEATTGLCHKSLANALNRLEACGLIKRFRRLIRDIIAGIHVCRQGSNLYSLFQPISDAQKLSVDVPVSRVFRKPVFKALADLLGWNLRPNEAEKREFVQLRE